MEWHTGKTGAGDLTDNECGKEARDTDTKGEKTQKKNLVHYSGNSEHGEHSGGGTDVTHKVISNTYILYYF